MLLEDFVNRTQAFLIFDEPGNVPVFYVMLDHFLKVFIRWRLPVLEHRLTDVELISIRFL